MPKVSPRLFFRQRWLSAIPWRARTASSFDRLLGMGKALLVPSPDQTVPVDPRPRARRFPIFALMLWALLALVVPQFVQTLNAINILAFPLGFFMNAQGTLIAFVLIAVVCAARQDRLQAREHEAA